MLYQDPPRTNLPKIKGNRKLNTQNKQVAQNTAPSSDLMQGKTAPSSALTARKNSGILIPGKGLLHRDNMRSSWSNSHPKNITKTLPKP